MSVRRVAVLAIAIAVSGCGIAGPVGTAARGLADSSRTSTKYTFDQYGANFASTTSSPPGAVLVPTKLTDTTGDLVEAIGVVVMMTMDGATLPEPDPLCFDEGLASVDVAVDEAAQRLAADPLAWSAISREARLPIITAYVGCADYEAVLNFLAIGTINSLDVAPCIADAWTGVLTADLIASSLAFGVGLDDLPPDVVRRMVDGVGACMPAELGWTDWWIEDIAIELEQQHGFTSSEATCVATNFVHAVGIDRALERRVLTIPMLALPEAELAAIDLPACGVTVKLPPLEPGEIGDCLVANQGQAEWAQAACNAPHNREVIAIVNLTDLMPSWPGIAAINEHASVACGALAEAAAAARDDTFRLYWASPTRQAWERGGRTVTCTVGPADYLEWTEQFGLVEPTSTTTSVAG